MLRAGSETLFHRLAVSVDKSKDLVGMLWFLDIFILPFLLSNKFSLQFWTESKGINLNFSRE